MADKTEQPAVKEAEQADPKPVETKAEPAPTVEAPYPSQADLDAIREGRFSPPGARAKRDLKPGNAKASYQTR